MTAPRRFPTLTVATPRLDVRPLTVADAAVVTVVFADRLVQRWMPVPLPYTLEHARAWCTRLAEERRASGAGDHYAAVRQDDGRVIGCVWVRHTDWAPRVTEISYAMAPDARGFGYAAEAVAAVALDLIREHDFGRVELRVAPGNTASRRVAEKAGFTYEGLLRNAGHVHSGRVDLEVWSLVSADLQPAR